MEFNYLKTGVMAALAVGALAFSVTAAEEDATAAERVAPVSVLPAEGTVETLESFVLTFDVKDDEGNYLAAAWNVTGTENAPYLTRNGERIATAGPANLLAEGNKLFINMPDEYVRAGHYELILADYSYVVGDKVGEARTYSWDVTGIELGVTAEPAINTVTEIQNIRITFNDNDVVTLTEDWGTTHGAYLFLQTENGLERRGTFLPQANGNVLDLTMREAVYEPGEYVVVVDPGCVFVDGVLYNEQLSFNYTVIEPSYPEVELSVNPAVDTVETLESIDITFGGVDIVEWAVTGTENAPYLVDLDGTRWGTFTKLSGEGNTLTLALQGEFDVQGEYKVVIPEGAYTFGGHYHGLAGKQIELSFQVLGVGGISVEPAVNTVTEIQNVKITFNEAKTVTLAEDLGTTNTPYLVLVNEEGQRERRGTFMPQVVGNNLLLTMNEAIFEQGEYVVIVPGTTYFLDGNPGEDIELAYTVIEPSYPEVDLSVNPAVDKVETLDNIEITFGGVDIVQWAVTGTENAPYLADLEGNRFATFTVLNGQGNMLSLGLPYDFDVKGEYQVVIPAGAYVFGGSYHGLPGKEIKLSIEVLGLTGISAEPSVNILNEIQNVKITFHEAKTVTLAENLGTTNTPYLVLVTEDGVRERRGTFMPQVAGNNLLLTMREPVYEEGEYVVVVPGTTYFLDGDNPGKDVELNYTVVAPEYPEVELSVNPAVDTVETLETIEVTFGGVDVVEWAVTGTENAPYLVDLEGNRFATFAKLGGQGNMLSLGLFSEFDVKGEYKVVIPEGSYVFQGIYHGMPGKQIELSYEVLGVGGITVEPAVNVLSQIQNLKITFNEAKEVTLAENLGTDNTPYLVLVNEEGVRERRGTFMPQVVGNNLLLTMNNPITEEGEYVVIVPGTTYFLDGNAGEDIELGFTVVAPSYPEVELSVNPATDVVETLETIEVTFGGVDVVEWAVTGTENAPYMVDLEGNRVATFAKIGGEGNMLSLGLFSEFDVKGEYKVIIPEGSYVFGGAYNGIAGKQIELSFEVLGLGGYSVEPAVDTVSEIQNVKITFNEAKTVTLAEDLGTTNTPYLVIVTEDGARERRGTFMPQVVGNNLLLTMNQPITEEGEYVVIVPGTTYFLDGNAGEDIELYYTVIGNDKINYTVEPAEGKVESLHTFAITFDPDKTVFWAKEELNAGKVAFPSITRDGGSEVALTDVFSHDYVLYAAPDSYEGWNENGLYVVTIPASSYYVNGVYGQEIVLNYIVEKSAVDAIFGEKTSMDVFDINGRVILRGADAEAVKALRGIFVIDGKKYILR